MTVEPWFNPMWSFLPGTLLGAVGGSGIGILAGIFAPQGKAKGLVYGFNAFFFLAGVVLLILGVAALAMGQPYAIWYALLLPGILGTCLFGGAFWILGQRYRQAELLLMTAKDF